MTWAALYNKWKVVVSRILFVLLSVSKQGVISSEPENIFISPENPTGDSASHLPYLSQFFISCGAAQKSNKTYHMSSSPANEWFVFMKSGLLQAVKTTYGNLSFKFQSHVDFFERTLFEFLINAIYFLKNPMFTCQ